MFHFKVPVIWKHGQISIHLLTSTRFYESAEFPDLSAIDWLVIMGGPMSVNDGDQYSWLSSEKAFIKKAIAAHKTVIGICLGSQLIADTFISNRTRYTDTDISMRFIQYLS